VLGLLLLRWQSLGIQVLFANIKKFAGAASEDFFSNLKFISLNCNSLNLASTSELFDLKIKSISSLKCDVLFLSDLRMGEIQNQSATHKITSAFQKTNLAHFDFYFNSSSNKRGVAMLILHWLMNSPIWMKTFL
jgi:exonuclease III